MGFYLSRNDKCGYLQRVFGYVQVKFDFYGRRPYVLANHLILRYNSHCIHCKLFGVLTSLYTALKFYSKIRLGFTIIVIYSSPNINLDATFAITMLRLRLIWIFAVFVVCSYCGKDFESIGRHRWRCKKRLENSTGPDGCINITQERNSGVTAVCTIIKCSCGKECKGIKGLKMHQRRCRVNENMDFDQPPDFENSNIESYDVANDNPEVVIESLQKLIVKPGVKLPRSNDNWSEANNYFKSIFSTLEVKADSVNEAIQLMNNTIYDFLRLIMEHLTLLIKLTVHFISTII